jgi:MarR family 2-MHQ and catechol resistance regulon transcriptional repressor
MTPKSAAKQPFMPLMRELVRTYQAFADFDARGHRDSGLTTGQADVIFTLGNTEGMTFKEIGERTLITKGTLTGVIDRLEAKGLVERVAHPGDRRCTRVRLTETGQDCFEKRFTAHIAYLKSRFDRLGAKDRDAALAALRKLRKLF